MRKRRTVLLGLWIIGAVALGLVWAGAVMADPGASPRNGPVDPAFRTDGRFTSSEDYDSSQGNSPGGVTQSGNSNGDTGSNSGKEKPGWLADHGKGLGLGLLEGAVLAGGVLLGAALLAISSPVVGVVAVGVLAGAALYGAFAGASRFNIIECAINGAIGGISAGLGAAVTGASLAGKAIVTGINMGAGGLASTTSYLFNTPDPTFGGAMAAFGLGAGTAGALTIGGQWLAKTKVVQNVASALHLGRKGAEVAVEASDELSKKASGMPSGVLVEAAEPVPVATKSQVMRRVAEAEWADPYSGPMPGGKAQFQESTLEDWQEAFGLRAQSVQQQSSTVPTRGEVLRAKYGTLTNNERMDRIDDLTHQNYLRRLNEALEQQEYVYRYTTRRRLAQYLESGRIDSPTYMTTEFSDQSAVTMDRNQVFSKWGTHQVGIRVPVKALVNPTVPRPFGGNADAGWELYTNSYPKAGSGGWLQFLAETDSLDPSWVFDLQL